MRLSELKNKYSGRIFLIGNGPSLQETPLHLLEDEYTFAVNSISDLFDQTEWRPSFYACVDDRVDPQYCDTVLDLGIPCFFPSSTYNGKDWKEIVPLRENSIYFNRQILHRQDDLGISKLSINWDSIQNITDVWSDDISNVVYGYNTIMYIIMQISKYMGFDEFYLLGNDLYDTFDKYLIFSSGADPALFESNSDYGNKVGFLKQAENPVRSLGNALAYKMTMTNIFNNLYERISEFAGTIKNENYFSEDYAGGELVTNERNQRHILAHELARFVSQRHDFDIYNATAGGHLEVHPRVDLQNVVKK